MYFCIIKIPTQHTVCIFSAQAYATDAVQVYITLSQVYSHILPAHHHNHTHTAFIHLNAGQINQI